MNTTNSIRFESFPKMLQLFERRIRRAYIDDAHVINSVLSHVEFIRRAIPALVLVKEEVLSVVLGFFVW